MEDPITIADKEYLFADLPPEAQKMLSFISDMDQQLNSMRDQMEMIQFSRAGCYARLLEVLENVEEKKPAA